MRIAVVVLGVFAACEHVDSVELAPPSGQWAAGAELQRVNVDIIESKVDRLAGVAPVRVPSLADPSLPTRERTVAREDEPPPPPPTPVSQAVAWFEQLSGPRRSLVRGICWQRRLDPCAGLLPEPPQPPGTPVGPKPIELLLAQLNQVDEEKAETYCRQINGRAGICDTPLVVSFDGEPVVFGASKVAFSFQPGVPVASDWPSPATPWIALDRDGDGAITSGAELFGDATPLAGGTARNGFEALAAIDANSDGVIDRRDPAFARLLLWADRDGDRRSSASELRPLADVVSAIPLANEVRTRCVDGNCEGERGAMTWRDASGRERTGAVIDVYLRRR